jgi:hypothetical protein
MANDDFEKIYIGKGKKVENYDIVEVSINMDEASKHSFEYQGVNYLKFSVAAMKKTDDHGKTHTAYLSKKKSDE